jgi:hypothetical protein
LGSKPSKRKKQTPRNIGVIETLHEPMENSMLGTPVDQNPLR